MAKWDRWIENDPDDELELNDNYKSFEPIKHGKHSSHDDDSVIKPRKKPSRVKKSPE